jgi:hypothetical protein
VFEAVVDEVVYGRAFLGVVAAVLAFQVVALGVALRRRRRGAGPSASMRLQVMAGLSILALPILAGVSVHAARALIADAIHGTDASEKARALSAGISGQLNAIPFTATATMLALLLWLPGFVVATDARDQERRLWPLARLALPVAGLAGIWYGALQWSTQVIHGFAAIAGIPPEAKAALLLQTLDSARARLELCPRMSSYAIVCLTVVAVALPLVDRWTRDRATGRGPAPGSPRRSLAGAVVALALAAGLLVAARPMHAENALPWPPPALGGAALLVTDPPTPDLEGPDLVERAPVVQVDADRLLLDGALVTTLDDLGSKLMTLRNNFTLLQPSEPWNGIALVIAHPKLSIPRLTAVLRTIKDAGYQHPAFTFTRAESTVRPTFGRLERVHATAVRATLIDAYDVQEAGDPRGGEKGTLVRPRDAHNYDELARQMVAVRGRDEAVVLDLGK